MSFLVENHMTRKISLVFVWLVYLLSISVSFNLAYIMFTCGLKAASYRSDDNYVCVCVGGRGRGGL